MDYKYIRSVTQDELKKARGGFETLDARADETDLQMADLTNQGQINGMAIKTQAEYDALPDSKLTDGIIYHIRG